MYMIRPDNKAYVHSSLTMSVFLAGTIDNGAAEPWAHLVADEFASDDIAFFNPRRENWLPDIEKRAHNPIFREQVEWELFHIETAHIVFFNFLTDSLSPITLQELGYAIARGSRMVVVCPDGFWRKGNVEIMCERFNIPVYGSLDEGIAALRALIKEMTAFSFEGTNDL